MHTIAANIDGFLSVWYNTGWLCTSIFFYLFMFLYDRGKRMQDAAYGLWLLFFAFTAGMFWTFTVPMFIIILLCNLPKALNKLLGWLKREWYHARNMSTHLD